jgi:succinoglycan biosynthesis protein ExoL
MKKVVMVCASSSQPRIIKRAISLDRLANVTVFGFRRRIYEQNRFPEHIRYKSLGYVSDGKYLRRVPAFLRALPKIRKAADAETFFYATSIDSLLMARLAGIKKGFYEVGDLRSCEKPKSLFSRLERYLISKASGVVLTSKYFYTDYFKHYEQSRGCNYCIIENKLDEVYSSFPRSPKEYVVHNRIKIGLVGLLRYEKPISWLINFVNQNSEGYELHCFGDGPLSHLIENSCNRSIFYYGPFSSPSDLAEIYKAIDINFSVYDNSSRNVQLALPNKFYESVFFNVPILAATNTAFAAEVEKLGVGKAISLKSEEEFGVGILEISLQMLRGFSGMAQKFESEHLIDESKIKLLELFESYE